MKEYPFLDLGRVNAPFADELKAAMARAVDSGRYVGGPENAAFEAALGEKFAIPHVVGVSNGLDALRLIFRGLIELGRLAEGDEVLVPAHEELIRNIDTEERRMELELPEGLLDL